MFSVKILGNNGPYPEKGGACSSYLVRAGDRNILLDAGSGSMSNLMKVMTPDKLDCIVLSHLHWDHMTDIPVMFYYLLIENLNGRLSNNIDLYIPGSPENMVKEIKKFNFFNIHILNTKTSFEVGDCCLTFQKMTHPVETYATKVEYMGKTFVYSGDTTMNDDLPEFAKDCDLLVVDSAFLSYEHTDKSPHMSALQCAGIAEKAGVSRLVLTHKNPFTDALLYEEEAGKVFNDVHMAKLMEELEV